MATKIESFAQLCDLSSGQQSDLKPKMVPNSVQWRSTRAPSKQTHESDDEVENEPPLNLEDSNGPQQSDGVSDVDNELGKIEKLFVSCSLENHYRGFGKLTDGHQRNAFLMNEEVEDAEDFVMDIIERPVVDSKCFFLPKLEDYELEILRAGIRGKKFPAFSSEKSGNERLLEFLKEFVREINFYQVPSVQAVEEFKTYFSGDLLQTVESDLKASGFQPAIDKLLYHVCERNTLDWVLRTNFMKVGFTRRRSLRQVEDFMRKLADAHPDFTPFQLERLTAHVLKFQLSESSFARFLREEQRMREAGEIARHLTLAQTVNIVFAQDLTFLLDDQLDGEVNAKRQKFVFQSRLKFLTLRNRKPVKNTRKN